MSDNRRGLAPKGDGKENQSVENIQQDDWLNEKQMEDLGTRRREEITSCDEQPQMIRRVDHGRLDRNRECNQPGSAAQEVAQAHSDGIISWNTFGEEAKDDGTEEEKLQDIGGGQFHREALTRRLAEHSGSGMGGHQSHSHQGTRSTRGSIGGRGRGGGVVGTRGRGGGRITRVPRIPSSPLAVADSTPAVFGSQDLRHASQGSAAENNSRSKESGYKGLRPALALDTELVAVPSHSQTAIVKPSAQAAKPARRLALGRLSPIAFSLATPDRFLASTDRFGSQSTQAVPPPSADEIADTPKVIAIEKGKSKERVSPGIVVNLPKATRGGSAESKLKEKEVDQIKTDKELAMQLDAEWNAHSNKTWWVTDRGVAEKDNFNKQSRHGLLGNEISTRQPQAPQNRAVAEGVIFTDFTDYGPPRIRKKPSDPDLISCFSSVPTSIRSEASSEEPSGVVPFNQSPHLLDLEGLVFPSDGAENTVPAGAAPVAKALQSTMFLPQQITEHMPSWRDSIPAVARNDPRVIAAYEAFQAAIAAAIHGGSTAVPVAEAGNASEIAPPPEFTVFNPQSGTAASAPSPKETSTALRASQFQHTPVEDSFIPSGGRPTIVRGNNPIVGGYVLPVNSNTLNQRASFNTGNVVTRASSRENQHEAKNPFAGPSQSATPKPGKVDSGEVQSSSAPKQNPFATPAVAQAASPPPLAVFPKKQVRVPDNAITRQHARGDSIAEKPPANMPGVAGSSSLVSTGDNGVGREDTGIHQIPTATLSSGTAGYPSNDPGAAARAQYGGRASVSNVAAHTPALIPSSSATPPHLHSSTPTLPAADTPAHQPRSALLTNTTQTGPIFGEHISRTVVHRGN